MNTKNSKTAYTGPRDILLTILASVGLYVIVIFFGVLIFQYINYYFPDALSYEYLPSLRETLRWAIAVLTVAFPLYLWINTYVNRELALHPEKRELKTRKWLLYITLFVAFLVIAGDIVALIYQFLQGEITTRFILKILTILLIAGAVFLYYGWNLKKEIPAVRHSSMRFFVWGVIAVVALSVASGFFVIGSPKSERLRQFDQRRVSDLQSIQWQVVNYWQSKRVLPPSLADLRDNISGYQPPSDPESAASYEYRVLGDLSFELCATFNMSFESATPDYPQGHRLVTQPPLKEDESWSHGEGRACFERTIDPDLYPPREKVPLN